MNASPLEYRIFIWISLVTATVAAFVALARALHVARFVY